MRNALTVEDVLTSPYTSHWLKAVLITALDRDPIDALHDVDVLASVLCRHVDALLGDGRPDHALYAERLNGVAEALQPRMPARRRPLTLRGGEGSRPGLRALRAQRRQVPRNRRVEPLGHGGPDHP